MTEWTRYVFDIFAVKLNLSEHIINSPGTHPLESRAQKMEYFCFMKKGISNIGVCFVEISIQTYTSPYLFTDYKEIRVLHIFDILYLSRGPVDILSHYLTILRSRTIWLSTYWVHIVPHIFLYLFRLHLLKSRKIYILPCCVNLFMVDVLYDSTYCHVKLLTVEQYQPPPQFREMNVILLHQSLMVKYTKIF